MFERTLLLTALLALGACGGERGAAPERITRFAFDSGGAHHLQGQGAWRIEVQVHPEAGPKAAVVHQVREERRTFGPFDLPASEHRALWRALEAAGIAGLEQHDRPGVPDEARYRFALEQGGREAWILVWQNDLPRYPGLQALLPLLRRLVETHCGQTPVF